MTPHSSGRNGFAAIVLAAGASSRMGALKPLLRIAGVTALERCITLFHDAGVEEVLVVLGNRGEELRPVAESLGARCIQNPDYRQGMFSSFVAGAHALPAWVQAVFVHPADIPMVQSPTVRKLIRAFTSGAGEIVYPVYAGRRGHPTLVARSIANHALEFDPAGPLSALLSAHQQHAFDLAANDQAIHLDMDTPAEFQALCALADHAEIPSPHRCETILAARRAPDALLRHSHKVAEVAEILADALAEAGCSLHRKLLIAAALLHDIAKGEPRHAEAGAAILREIGMPGISKMVALHSDLSFAGEIDEAAILYLADKLVAGDRCVTLADRFERSMEHFGKDPEAVATIRNRRMAADQISAAIEQRVGRPLPSILDRAEVGDGAQYSCSASAGEGR